jgi:hypothetical protein
MRNVQERILHFYTNSCLQKLKEGLEKEVMIIQEGRMY